MDFNTRISKRIDELNAVCRVVFPENSYKQFREHYNECEISIRNGHAEFVENRKYTYTTYDVFYETTSRYYKHVDPESRRGLVGIYSWIQTKTLYAFDPELIVNFNKMSWNDLKDYPVDIFNQLPMDCFAIMMNEDCEIDSLIFDTMIIINDRKHTQIIENHTIAMVTISRPYKRLQLYLMIDPHHITKKHISSKKRYEKHFVGA